MSPFYDKENLMQPSTLQEASNIIKFLKTTHKLEISKWKEAFQKQVEIVQRLEDNRKKELEFLSSELQKYEMNLAQRTESVAQQLAEKDEIIDNQAKIIEEQKRLNFTKESSTLLKTKLIIPEITILNVDSNSDSGIAMENEDCSLKSEPEVTPKSEIKTRKCSRRFAESISFLRRVDFSPMKYKARESTPKNKKDDVRKKSVDLSFSDMTKVATRHLSDRTTSDDDRSTSTEFIFSDSGLGPYGIRPKKMNESMNNHFSDDGSEDTSEEVFDRVMTRSSVRRSVKANPKYKKINRTKSKLLEQVKVNIMD